jgi:hypothetical protein
MEAPPETTRFDDGEFVEIKVNGTVVGRVEERPESSSSVEDEAAVAVELDQLVQSMNELLRDHHDTRPEEGDAIAAEIVAHREDTVEAYTSDHGEWRSVSE